MLQISSSLVLKRDLVGGREHRGGAILTSKEALIGMRVRVSEPHLKSEQRGLEGTITGRWGSPDYVASDVLLDDGSSQLFWHHELEEL
jgi:hypothetical protein